MADAALEFYLELIGHRLFPLVKGSVSAQTCKIIAMDNQRQAPFHVLTAARARFVLDEAHGHKSVTIHRLLYVSSVASAIKASLEFAQDIFGQPKFSRKSHIKIPGLASMKVPSLYIDKGNPQWLTFPCPCRGIFGQ